jgi:hypothetical protein
MYYLWTNNKTAQVWFRNKRKPPEVNNKLVDESGTPFGILFGSQQCRTFFDADVPTVERFGVFRLTNQIGGYKASGTIFVNDPKLVVNIRKYCFTARNYISGLGLYRLVDVNFYTYSQDYDAKIYGTCEVPEKLKEAYEKSNIDVRHQISHDTKHIYASIVLDLPNIAEELFSIIPKVKRKE